MLIKYMPAVSMRHKMQVNIISCYHWLETWTLRKLERKYLKSFEMWCWRRMQNIKWLEKVTNEQVLDRIGEKRTQK